MKQPPRASALPTGALSLVTWTITWADGRRASWRVLREDGQPARGPQAQPSFAEDRPRRLRRARMFEGEIDP